MYIKQGNYAVPVTLGNEIIELQAGKVYEISLNKEVSSEHPGFTRLIEVEPLRMSTKINFTDEQWNLINRISKYEKERREPNLGVVIHGLPGSGKTTMANYLAIQTGLPIIKVTTDLKYSLLDRFAEAAKNGVVFLFDESDKQSNNDEDDERRGTCFSFRTYGFLTFLDGSNNSKARKTCFFCANKIEEFPEEVKNRPGRIRYWIRLETEKNNYVKDVIKEYGITGADAKTLYEFIVTRFETKLKDTVRSFIEEVTIFPDLTLDEIAKDLNIKFKDDLKFKDVTFNKGISQSYTIGEYISDTVKKTNRTRDEIMEALRKINQTDADRFNAALTNLQMVEEYKKVAQTIAADDWDDEDEEDDWDEDDDNYRD